MLLACSILALGQLAPTGDPCAAALTEFRAAINPGRAGDAVARARMLEQAEFLAEHCGRPECRDVARYYAGFDDEALRAGLAIEARVLEVRTAYDAATRAGTDAEAWSELLARLILAVDAISGDGARLAEWVSGLRATSLAARLRLQALELDPSLAPSERAALADRARADAERALAGFDRVGQVGASLEPRWIAGRLARLAGERQVARACFERCLADAEHVGVASFQRHALRGLLALARDAGDLAAEERALAALARIEGPERSWWMARDWASVLLAADHAREALDYLERRAPPEEHAAERRDWHMVAGSAALRARELEAARRHLEAAFAGRSDPAAVLALARLELARGDAARAREMVETALEPSELEPIGAVQMHALLGEAALAAGNPARARDELLQALAGARGWEAFLERDPLDPAALRGAPNVIGEWLGVHTLALLAWTLAESGDALEAARVTEEYQARALRRRAAATGELRALAGLAPAELTRDDLRAWAASREAGLLTWVIGPDFGVALHVAADGRAWAGRVGLGRAALGELVRRFEEALVGRDEAWRAELGRELARALLPEPLATRLASAPANASLLCLPHGVLEPLALERVELWGLALEERFVLSVLPGLVAQRPRAARSIAEWSFLGAPSASSAAPLPSARAELEHLAARTPGARLVLGDAFTRQALLAALASDGALHVATHALRARTDGDGRFAPVGLEVAGGDVVAADEIRRTAGALELVLLSSCAGASGRMLDAEGLHGLARAFLEAGTRDVVATLRAVSDRAAHDFALAFARRLALGDSRAAAVRAARRELALAGHPPADWTAFRLLGQD